MNKKEQTIVAIRELAGDIGLYRRERLEALTEIQREVNRQLEWMLAQPHGGVEPVERCPTCGEPLRSPEDFPGAARKG